MRDGPTGVVDLTVEEFSLLWFTGGFGDPPAAMPVRHLGRTAESRARIVEETSELLGARALGSVTRPAEHLAEYLRLLARHTRACDALAVAAETWHGLAATDGTSAMLAEAVGDSIRFSPIHPTGMATAALRGVPSAPAGPGRAASVRLAEFRSACAGGTADTGFLAALRESGLREPEAYTVLRAVGARTGGGQVGARVRVSDGRTRRAGTVLSWTDTTHGRYTLRVRDGWLTVAPADDHKLGSMVAELLSG